MDFEPIQHQLTQTQGFDLVQRRPGKHQVIAPIYHEDGDMLDIYLKSSSLGGGYVRICDYGLALMRLSYTFDLNTGTKREILNSILKNSDVEEDDGNLYIDVQINYLFEGIMQFAGCVQKVCNMRYWSREVVRSAFYDDLGSHVADSYKDFVPKPKLTPLPSLDLTVDWTLSLDRRSFYLFGVRGNDKANLVSISLLEFKLARLSYVSVVVHEDMSELGTREQTILTRNADKQYPNLDDFRESGVQDLQRLAGLT